MGVWKIYHKDGTIVKDVDGNEIDIRSLEYLDSWMGECYLDVTFRHETPIDFMMGDYIIYRNEKFVLNYEPGKDKKARINTCGDGFVYSSVKFNSLQNELSDAEFLDVVLNDNELHYTALPKFQFYVETLDDLLDRIQANLNEQIGAGEWKIFSRNKDRSEQRGCTADEWNAAYGEGTGDNVIDSMSITADSLTCWDALALVNSKWNVNFIVRGRNVYVGTAGVTIGHMFEYGRDNGLYEIEQNADSEQKVITRLRAYGSEKNLPSHYYADLGVKYVANITKVVGASTNVELELDTDYIETYFKNKRKYVVSGESQEQENGWVLKVTFDFQTIITGYVTQLSGSNKCRFYSELKGTQTDSGDEESKEKLDAFIAQVKAGNTKMYITSGLNKNSVPSSMKEYAENLPNNMSISRLMLPGFPSMSLNDYYNSLSEEDKAYVNPKGKQYIFSTDKYRPYVDSANISKIGLHSSSQFFDTDDKTNGIIEIYPTLEEMVIGGVRVDEINEGVAPADNGRFEDGQNVANVDIYLSPNIDFDITGLKQSDFSISMKDGMCGGRTFTVAATNKVGNRWRLTIKRVKDSALDLWFPYQDYPIKAGDHFVLTGITLPDSYVKAASLKLLKYTLALLDKNDYTRYVYQPKVDELFMARQHDAAMADETGAIKSLHDTLKAGDLMDFMDDDLNIKGTITIDQLNIKEQDGKIPTYEITLREDKEVSTIQKIQQQITSLESGNGGSGGGGGITLTQVKGQVASEGSKVFLSKLTDDTAQGKITFMKGLIAKALADLAMGAKFGNNAMITKLGDAVFNTIKSIDYDNAAEQGFSIEKEKSGKYHAFITNLTIWGKARFHELEMRKLSYSGGNIYLSGAGSKLIKVVPVKQSVSANGVTTWVETTEDDAERVGWKCYLLADNGTTATMNYWQEGDQVRCQTMGEIASGGTYNDASNKSYWRTIPDGGVSTQNEKIYGTKTETYRDEDGNEQTREVQVELYDGQAFAWIVIGKHCDDIDGYDDEFSVGYDGTNPAPLETRDIPSAGDTIVLDGNRHRDVESGKYDKTDRQNVIVLETTGEYAPRIACFANITEYKHTITKHVNGEKKEVSLSVFETSPKGGTKINSSRFEWISDDGSTINIINYRGDWVENNKYHKNDQVNHNNAVWVCVANSGVNVTDEPLDGSPNWKKVLVGGKGEKGDDAVSYSVSLMKSLRTVAGHSDQSAVTVSFRKQEGSKSTVSGNITTFGDSASVKCYIDGELSDNMTDWINSGNDYFGYLNYENAWAGKSVITVVMYIGSNIVASANFSLGQSGEGVVMAYKNATSQPSKPTVEDLSQLSGGWSRTPREGGSYNKVSNISYGNYSVDNTTSGYSTSEWSEVSDSGETWRKSPAGLSDSYGWAIMKVSFSTNVDNLDVNVIIKAYSEANFDFVQVHELDTEIIGSNDLRKKGVAYISGNGIETSYSYHVATAGQHFFYVSYCKDSSTNKNGDYGLFRFDLSDNLVTLPSTVWMSQATLKDGKAVLPWSKPVKITGEDAYRVVVFPSALVFDTDDNGMVNKSSLSGKTATIRVYQGDKDVSSQFSKYDRLPSNYYNCNGSLKDLNESPLEIQVTEIETQKVTDDAENESTISKTNGFLEFILENGSATVTAHVDVQVNVAMFTGQMVNTNKRFSNTLSEVSTSVNGKMDKFDLTQFKAEITQTAREISLSVSEKAIGRRNLLVGSAARRQGEGWTFMSGSYYNGLPCDSIEINSGYDGVNAIHCRTKQTGTNSYYLCGLQWIGTYSQQGNIKLKKGKSYTLSFWAKAYNSGYVNFMSELIWQGSATDNSRPAGYAGPNGFVMTQQATKNNTWTLFKVNIEVPSSAPYEYVEVNIFARATNYTLQDAYICKPMLEEGDYNGWTLSEQDYDYVGGNLLDNTRTLTVGGNLNDVGESTIISQGYGYDSAVAHADNSSGSSYKDILKWRTTSGGNMSFQKGKDYLLSFLASGSGRMTCYLFCSANNTSSIYSENNQGYVMNNVADGASNFTLSSGWKRYWVHFRVLTDSSLPTDILMRAVIGTNVYVAQPKLEEGATMTEYTERKSDFVDKASLKAAGIEITSDQVTLYGNKVQVKTPKTNSSEGYDEAAMFQNGKLNAQFINAGDIVAEGINAKEIKATKLNVTGDSKIGIWHITKVDGWGYVMQAEGTEYNGATVVSGIQYCPLFVRGGSLNTAYFRVGASCTEFSYQSNLNHFNAAWFGDAARIVCKGSANSVNLPTNYDYNIQYEPVQYIYSEQSKQESPALAINVIAKGFSGTPTAIQTNGAIRGVFAPNSMSISSYNNDKTIPNGIGVVICTNNTEMTLTLPANPLEGQTLIIIQGNTDRVYIVPYGDEKIYCHGQTRDKNNKFYSGTIGQFNIFVYVRGAWQLQWMNQNP